jgi:hypothetical protein
LNKPELADLWASVIEARNWIILGDPAVHLMVDSLRPETESLRLLYRIEDLVSQAAERAQEGDLVDAKVQYEEALKLNPWLGIEPERRPATLGRARPGPEAAEGSN